VGKLTRPFFSVVSEAESSIPTQKLVIQGTWCVNALNHSWSNIEDNHECPTVWYSHNNSSTNETGSTRL